MTSTAPPLTRPRILVVDDEVGPRESLRMLLKPQYEVRTADGARTALQELADFRPDLVILDIKMPGMDGLEVLRRIKRVDPSIEVVMITAYASLETVKTALSHGAFEYLIKPFSRQDLEEVVRRALGRRQAELGQRNQVARLVEEMRRLASKTRELEEAARREAAEQSLRVTQLTILREIARTVVSQLDPAAMAAAVTDQLRRGLGYDTVRIVPESEPPPVAGDPTVAYCALRDAEGPLGYLVVDNRSSGRPIDARERELLEMLAEYLAVAVRNSRLYTEIATTKRSLEHLIASAGDAIVPVDGHDRIEGWNPAAERMFGVPATQARGCPITTFLPEAEYAEARRRLQEGAPMVSFETTLSGAARPLALAVTLSALRGRQGELEGVLAIVRDITAQREAEQQLHQSEKLTALGQLAGGIAHDFNNLLQAILGYTQLMKQNVTDVNLLTRSLQVLEAAALDGSETVRRIQQFARLRPDEQFVPVDLNQIVHDALAIIRPRWEEVTTRESRQLELRLDLGAVGRIQGRPAALTELLTNLFLNALDAMPRGGTLTVTTREHPPGTAVVTVADTGIGMPEAVQRRIFEPFFSTKGEAGSGLGLAMAYAIVRRHRGEIRVASQPGRGATFTITFPVARESSATAGEATAERVRRAARVLVVDDDPQVLTLLAQLLESQGHTVTAAASGPAGLEQFAPGRYDVVLANLAMPGMNGWQFAERLRALDPKVPLLLLTGWGLREEDQARLAALGVQRCLFKPVPGADLDAAIQAALADA